MVNGGCEKQPVPGRETLLVARFPLRFDMAGDEVRGVIYSSNAAAGFVLRNVLLELALPDSGFHQGAALRLRDFLVENPLHLDVLPLRDAL